MPKKQKFPMYATVKVCKDMPSWMSHFDSDFVGIVKGTYKQLHGMGSSNSSKSYALYKLGKSGKIVDTIAWYDEYQLSFYGPQGDKNIIKNLKKITKYLE